MASISNISNARSMNGIITLTDGFATIENGIITSDNIITSNIITDDINLNIGDGRHLSLFDDLNNKAYYSDILSLSGLIYNYENINNNNTIYNYGYSISDNLNKLQNNIHNYVNTISGTCNNLQNQINNCIESGYNIM